MTQLFLELGDKEVATQVPPVIESAPFFHQIFMVVTSTSNLPGNRVSADQPQAERAVLPHFPHDDYLEPEERPLLSDVDEFLLVHPQLRTSPTNIAIFERRVGIFLRGLKFADVTPELKEELLRLGEIEEGIVSDLRGQFLDWGALVLLGPEHVQNGVFQTGGAYVFRLNINMTDADRFSPDFVTAYGEAVLAWLQEEFGPGRVPIYDGYDFPHVTRNPEGSSFMVVGVPKEQIEESMARFADGIRERLRRPEGQVGHPFDVRYVDKFEPRGVGMFMEVDADGLGAEVDGRWLGVNEIVKTGNKALILLLVRDMLSRIEDKLRILGAGANLAEKDPASIGLASGLTVYSTRGLPRSSSDTGFEIFMEALKLSKGSVPNGVYTSPVAGRRTGQLNGVLRRRPRPSHEVGRLKLALVALKVALKRVANADTDEGKKVALSYLKETYRTFSELLLNIAWLARRNPRNMALLKWSQKIKLPDGTIRVEYPFLESLALMPDDSFFLMPIEVDAFKAFSGTYAVDDADSNFWGIFDQFLEAAVELNIERPVIDDDGERRVRAAQYGGDLGLVAIPKTDLNGKRVDLNKFIALVKGKLHEVYGDKMFQDYGKIPVPNGTNGSVITLRIPLWRVGDNIIASHSQPFGGVPLVRSLTVSVVGTEMPTPRTEADAKLFREVVGSLATLVETVKEWTAPEKNQNVIVSFADVLESMSMLRGERRESSTSHIAGIMRDLDQHLGFVLGDEWSGAPARVRAGIFRHVTKTYSQSEGPFMLNPNYVRHTLEQSHRSRRAHTSPRRQVRHARPTFLFRPLTHRAPAVAH